MAPGPNDKRVRVRGCSHAQWHWRGRSAALSARKTHPNVELVWWKLSLKLICYSPAGPERWEVEGKREASQSDTLISPCRPAHCTEVPLYYVILLTQVSVNLSRALLISIYRICRP